MRKLYGVPSTLGFLPGRVTYVIDKKGMVRHIFSSQSQPTKHIEEALKIVKDLSQEWNSNGNVEEALHFMLPRLGPANLKRNKR